jgi:hypothetical protein
MAYYNTNPLIQQLFPSNSPVPMFSSNQQQLQINPQQFISVAATLDDHSVQQLVQMARQRGISDQDIQSGLGFINQYRKK